MAEPEEDKNSEVSKTPSAPDKPAAANNDQGKSAAAGPASTAAVKVPSNEATQELLELLGTVGNAGLGATIELAAADKDAGPNTWSGQDETSFQTREETSDQFDSDNESTHESPGSNVYSQEDEEPDAPPNGEHHACADSPPSGQRQDDDSGFRTHTANDSKTNDRDDRDSSQSAPSSDRPQSLKSRDHGGQDFKRLDALSGRVGDELGREHFQSMLPDAVDEIRSGMLGPATVALFGIAERSGIVGELKQEYLRIAFNSGSRLEDLTANDSADEVRFRIKGAPPCEMTQSFNLQMIPGIDAILKEQKILHDRLDCDPLTSRLCAPDWDEDSDTLISTSERARRANVEVPEEFKPEKLDLLQAPMPSAGMTLAAFARSAGLAGDDINAYFQAVFFKTHDPWLRQEALQCLRDEIVSGANKTALQVLQELIVCKAAIELKEAEKAGNDPAALQALAQIAALEDISPRARIIMQESSLNPAEDSYDYSIVDHAREAARDMARSTFEAANLAYSAFLSRDGDRLPLAERHAKRLESIRTMILAGEQRLYQMARDDFSHLSGALKSMDALMTITETNDPQVCADELGKLMKLQVLDENVNALDYLSYISNALQAEQGAPSLEQIHRSLLAADGRGKDSLKVLKACLPDVIAERNEYRLQQIMKTLGPESSSTELKMASKTLEEEEKVYANNGASELLKWTRAGESAARIDEVIKARSLDDLESVKATAETIKTEMERLSRLALQANESARSTLVGMLMSGSDPEAQDLFFAAQERRALVPDLSRLSATERSIVREHAALSVEESLKKNPNLNPLRPSCGAGLAVALAETYAHGDRNVQKAIEATFDTALKCLSRSPAIDGLIQAMSSDLPGSGKLSELILKALSSTEGLSNTQRTQIALAARQGVPGAIRTLAAACALESPSAALAASDLVKAGASASNRDRVLAIMLDQYQRSSDKHSLLAALGDIASRDNPARPLVLETIRQAIEDSASKPDSPEYKSALKGLLFLAESWGAKEINALRHNLRMEMLAALPSIADKLAANVRELFLNSQHEVLLYGTPEERLSAVQALGALGRFTRPEVATDIGFFIMPQGRAELERTGFSKEKMAIFADFAARTLLSIMSSSDPKVQEAAFDSFRRQGDWQGMLAESSLRKMIIDYVQGRSTELELNKEAMQLVYDAGLARPLFGTFKDLGVGGDKISTQQLLQLCDRAAGNYATPELDGKAVVHKVLANAATLNALSPSLREKIMGCSAAIDMSQLAGQLINGTIDAHHPPNNPLFTDMNKRLLQEQREIESLAAMLQSGLPETDLLFAEDLQKPEKGTKTARIGMGRSFYDTFSDQDVPDKNQAPHLTKAMKQGRSG